MRIFHSAHLHDLFGRGRLALRPSVTYYLSQFPSAIISFILADGVALGVAVDAAEKTFADHKAPAGLLTQLESTASALAASTQNGLFLIVATLGAVYIALGVLDESSTHPSTILSTLRSAGVDALLALLLFHQELTVIAIIGIILLRGIVRKNAILNTKMASPWDCYRFPSVRASALNRGVRSHHHHRRPSH